ncbi:MAG TPA: SAM-dependent methyltransferase [Saprospiraceae bacterium]|nr:SAM-dependent methyltransferase [Saprospiraceae bacterium]
MSTSPKGKLYLIPTPIAEDSLYTIPPYVTERLHQLKYFIAERAKTARRFIKTTEPRYPISELHFFELNKRTSPEERNQFLDKVLEGQDMGLLSEAGCPGVADPGAKIVAQAHRLGIRVVPLVGPSSILLALMASGMNGQSFAFHGYLSVKTPELIKDLKNLEQAARHGQTQLFIEAPYRNRNVVEQALKNLRPDTFFGIAMDLTAAEEYVRSLPIQRWQQEKLPELHKRPAIFMVFKG